MLCSDALLTITRPLNSGCFHIEKRGQLGACLLTSGRYTTGIWLVVRVQEYMFLRIVNMSLTLLARRNNKGIDELLICLLAVKWEVTLLPKCLVSDLDSLPSHEACIIIRPALKNKNLTSGFLSLFLLNML